MKSRKLIRIVKFLVRMLDLTELDTERLIPIVAYITCSTRPHVWFILDNVKKPTFWLIKELKKL